jgi:hypothetical protein
MPEKDGKCRCQYPKLAKQSKPPKKWNRELESFEDKCDECPSIKMRYSEQILLSLYPRISGQAISGPMGALISLDYIKVTTYLKDLGYNKSEVLLWLFDHLNMMFITQLQYEATKGD